MDNKIINGRKKRVLFISADLSDFYGRDYNILRKHFDVKVLQYSGMNTLKFLCEVYKGVLWTDITFSWFADVHAFVAVLFSKILKKKSIVVAGGYEVANEPEINYGIMRGFPKSKSAGFVRFVLKYADMILPFSRFATEEVLSINPSTKLTMVPLACDSETFISAKNKENVVLTVCELKQSNIARKGLKTFVESAKYLPDVEFVLVGPHLDDSVEYLKEIASPNVKFTGYVSEEELIKWYQRAKVYVQVSAHEGFGVAITEAMSCECVPVITDRGAIPEVVGDTGFYVPYADPKATAEAIKKALKSDKGKEAGERIRSMFPKERREDELLKVIKEVYSNGR